MCRGRDRLEFPVEEYIRFKPAQTPGSSGFLGFFQGLAYFIACISFSCEGLPGFQVEYICRAIYARDREQRSERTLKGKDARGRYV